MMQENQINPLLTSIFLEPGLSLSSKVYISSGLREVSRTYTHHPCSVSVIHPHPRD